MDDAWRESLQRKVASPANNEEHDQKSYRKHEDPFGCRCELIVPPPSRANNRQDRKHHEQRQIEDVGCGLVGWVHLASKQFACEPPCGKAQDKA
jgi:hypothetical protein